ncbi:MAG TPA: asparagine synthase (glutamine-hydrolyzing) [Sandaracinaceae bacterium LLY-WYZ-13_1]|nr:asparagine synthase (glutamine-hydrolyzing) [Sandaracinaceae bacterium LLY-WYZ-13_1]
MCGIAGAVGGVDPERVAAVERMTEASTHRGPDQSGLWTSLERGARGRGVVFGHRRLSILDVSEAGRQPMVDEASGVVLTFNGEVYNFAELRRELRALGDEIRSGTDTEVVLKAYARWGDKVVARLRGMFAFAAWDPRDETVLLARDAMGIKPLYLTTAGDSLLFASELRALLASDAVDRRLDPRGLMRFLWHGFVPGPGTLIEGVSLLAAGTTLRVGLDGRRREPRRYWQLPRAAPGDEGTSVRRLGETLEDAVRLRMVADVPLGVFLSGGVDSSAVAALATRTTDAPVRTFNIRFEEARFDESPHARAVAERLGTEHHEVPLSEAEFVAHLDDALASIDQPTFDAINTYFVSRAVKEAGLTVALAGTGGDELFGGYPSFSELPRARRVAQGARSVPEPVLRRLARIATRLKTGRASEVPPQTRWGKLADVLATRGDLLALYQVSYGLFARDLYDDLALRPAQGVAWGLDDAEAEAWRAAIAGEPTLAAISQLELRSFVGERLLRDTDAASMAVSLEVRVPLLDHAVIDALARVPEARRYAPLGRKALLRQMVARELDPSLFDRPKAGFELPLSVWCREGLGPELADTLQDVVLAYRIGLDGEAVGRLWRAFAKGGPGIYWSRVWALFVLMRWCREHGVQA